MSFSSSSSSSSYRGSSSFPANTTTPHFPPIPENRTITQDAAQFTISSSPSYTNYPYNYSNYNHSGGASTASRAEERDESGDLPPEEEEREHMFDKVVTPSDVGKLNRLVIPKQHAEKYFPLDSSSSEKGLLLDFEDRSGKSWRFRYSYWNSSQSYVMTKGWSRFVKEKKLDAGDVVSFHRGIGEDAKNQFFIDWRRRPQPPPPQIQFQHRLIHHSPFLLTGPRPPPPVFHHPVRDHRHLMTLAPHPNHHRGSVISYSGLDNANNTYNYGVLSNPNFVRQAGPVVYMRGPPPPHHQMHRWNIPAATSSAAAASSNEPMVLDSVPVVADVQSNAGKRLRLFGVNMDCTVSDSQVNSTEVMSHRSSPSVDEEEAVEESLQLSLIHGGTASDSDLLDKGKSSMSLDFDLTEHS